MRAVSTIFLLSWMFPIALSAMEFSVERVEVWPIRPPALHITATGPIETKDTGKLRAALDAADRTDVQNVLFMFDSPGGNLLESLEMGDFIADIPAIVVAQVGGSEMPSAICASACVFVFLGADYRYLADGGKIGIHRAGISDAAFEGSEGVEIGQAISGIVSEYIRKNRAEPELFEAISAIDHNDIAWLSRDVLEQWRVVTNDVYDERMAYINVNGKIALRMRHIAIEGESVLTLTCTDSGLVGVADLHEPDVAAFGSFEVIADGIRYNARRWDVLKRENQRAIIVFNMPEDAARAARQAETFGVRVVTPSGDLFFGFEQTLRDGRLAELERGCPAAEFELNADMQQHPGLDFRGHDLTTSGIRGISFSECQWICALDRQCQAVSYVINKNWCWPKASTTGAAPASGLISASKP